MGVGWGVLCTVMEESFTKEKMIVSIKEDFHVAQIVVIDSKENNHNASTKNAHTHMHKS